MGNKLRGKKAEVGAQVPLVVGWSRQRGEGEGQGRGEPSRGRRRGAEQEAQIIEEGEKLYVHSKKLAGRPTINALNTLFPTACIVESSSNFIIKENIDANKLPLNWTRCMTPDGLCIMK